MDTKAKQAAFGPERITIVLVEPQQPGNIGSIARAMDNMGVTDLRLVNPCDHLAEEARRLATHAFGLLEQAQVYATLPQALAGCQLVLGATARPRKTRQIFKSSRELPQLVQELPPVGQLALVFGPERIGLTNLDLSSCRYGLHIPTYGENPSLNLAQAALVLLYELAGCYDQQWSFDPMQFQPAGAPALEGLKQHLFEVLEDVNFIRPGKYETLWYAFSEMLARAQADIHDVKMVRGFLNRVQLALATKRRPRVKT